MGVNKKSNIAVWASGSGSNAEAIIKYFQNSEIAGVTLVITNNPDAYVVKRAKVLGVQTIILNNSEIKDGTNLCKLMNKNNIDYIILAGYLKKIPSELISEYHNKIINIHPSLLPKFGGKGMFGLNVHQSVLKAKEELSGITIHYVNQNYDEGGIIFQKQIDISSIQSPIELQKKINELELEYYPQIIEKLILNLL